MVMYELNDLGEIGKFGSGILSQFVRFSEYISLYKITLLIAKRKRSFRLEEEFRRSSKGRLDIREI